MNIPEHVQILIPLITATFLTMGGYEFLRLPPNSKFVIGMQFIMYVFMFTAVMHKINDILTSLGVWEFLQ